MVRGRKQFDLAEPALLAAVCVFRLLPGALAQRAFRGTRNLRGLFGIGLRYCLVAALAERCGRNVSIREGVFLLAPKGLRVGSNVSIHPMCYIDCTGGLGIGDDVSIAHGVTIMSTTHNYSDAARLISEQMVAARPTSIGSDVWLGAGCKVIGGISIGDGAVVGAGAVVTRDVGSYEVVGGIPARRIGSRE